MDRILFEADGLPVFQNVTCASRADALAYPRGRVQLIQDGTTGLVRNAAFDAASVIYDENYQNEQALSPAFQQHLSDVEGVIRQHMGDRQVVEIGCGKGTFLELLLERGWDVRGCDPSYEGSNPRVIKAMFDASLDLAVDAIVLRHVLEHIEDPFAFLAGVKQAAGGKGLIYIEVPCFDWICAHRAWFDVFYEHVNYFRLSDLERMFGDVRASGRLFGDQYIYVIADLASLRAPRRDDAQPVQFPNDFLGGLQALAGLPDSPRAIWGASSKGVVFAIHAAAAGARVDFAVDVNPVKQDRYLPCSGLMVRSPAAAMASLPEGAEILVMNSNYLDEIRVMTEGRFQCIAVDRP